MKNAFKMLWQKMITKNLIKSIKPKSSFLCFAYLFTRRTEQAVVTSFSVKSLERNLNH